MDDYEDAVQRLRDEGVDDDIVDIFEKHTASNLRKQAGRVGELEKELEAEKARARRLETAPKRVAAFKQYGVDIDALRPLERAAIENFAHEGDEPTAEEIAKFVEANGIPVGEAGAEGEESDETPAAAAVAAQAVTATERSVRGKTTITPKEAAEWSTEKAFRFREKNPDAWQTLMRGEEVVGVAAP